MSCSCSQTSNTCAKSVRVNQGIHKNGKRLQTKPHKLFHHLDRVQQWLNGDEVAPIFVELGPVNSCNQACPWCYTAYVQGKIRMDKEFYLRVVRQLAEEGVRSVCVQGTGEPFLNKHTPDAIVLGHQLGMEMASITNGVLVTESVAGQCVEHLSWMKISAIESQPRLYSINHGCTEKQYAQLLKNIEAIVRIRDRLHDSEFVLSTSMLVCENNWHTIEDVVGLARQLGFDFIQVRAPSGNDMIQYQTQADLHKDKDVFAIIERAQALATESFQVDIRIDSFEDQNKGPFPKEFGQCYGQELETLIDADGHVYPCLRFWGDQNYSLGNLHEHSFQDIWHSAHKKKILKKIWNEWDLDQCVMVCKHSFINKPLWELKHPPLHKNFL